MEDYELRIDDMYFEHDHPEMKGKSMQEIHEYNLGYDSEAEKKKKNDQWFNDNLNSANSMMFGGLAATICSL
jgi:hypothetical protein